MVYRGKPSAACGECRKRRNRCDLAVPACGQCLKAKRKCPGYRNTTDLLFFDESSKVARKHTKSKSPASNRDPERHPTSESGSPIRLTEVILYQPVDDIALNFFMANYVGNDINSQFEYMPNLYSRYGFSHADIQDSIKAVGMAGYSKAARRPELMQAATKKYVSALRNVNLAVSKPELAMQDTTLTSVLLLAMFEVMSMPREQGLKNLNAHLDGALSLSSMRIGQEEHSMFTMKLLKSVCQAVTMTCWVQNTPLPAGLLRMIENVKRAAGPSDLHPEYMHLIASLIDFRHTPVSSPYTAIERAVTLDTLMNEFTSKMPQEAQFIRHFGHPDDVRTYKGYYHTYHKNFTADFWDNLRLSRIWLHEGVIARCCSILASPQGSMKIEKREYVQLQLETSLQEIQVLAHDICCTVPQLAGYVGELKQTVLNFPVQSTFRSKNVYASHTSDMSYGAPLKLESAAQRTGRTTSQYHLLFQLRKLARCPHLDTDMHAWIAGRIAWVESLADPSDVNVLSATAMSTTPSGSFPFFVNRPTHYVHQGIRLMNLATLFSHSWEALAMGMRTQDVE